MCNLYSMTSNQEAMRRLFKFRPLQLNLPSLPAIFPSQDAPVVRQAGDDRELVMMSWGFVLPQEDKAPKRVTNARNDKVADSRFWRSSFEERRCLVPVTSFAEYHPTKKHNGRKAAVWFGLKGDEVRPLFAFAGIWRSWRGNLKGDLVELDVYAFLTTTPNDVVKPIHPNRMPVILRPEDYGTWLNGSPADAHELAVPYAADEMEIVYAGETKDEAT